MDKVNFRRILARNVGKPLGVGIVGSGLFLILIFYLLSALSSVEHTDQVIANSADASRLSVDLETGMRGFLITGDENFLDPYDAGKSRIDSDLASLRALVAGNPVQVNRLDSFKQQLDVAGCSVSLHAHESAVAMLDEYRIEQVLANLLTNAARYGAGKPVQVRLLQMPDEVVIDVCDEGMGIAAHDQARIFEQFERATANHSGGGLGLGLYISRQIVQAHGGELRVESLLGEGSTFRVRLPRHAEQKAVADTTFR